MVKIHNGFIFIVVLMVLSGGPLHAQGSVNYHWVTSNVFEIPSHQVKLTRPNDRWRVMETADYGVVNLIYHQHGQNTVIEVSQWPHFHFLKARLFQREASLPKGSFRTALLQPLVDQGFKFFKFQVGDRQVFAMGTNSTREILMVHFYFAEGRDFTNPVVIQMTVPREQYHQFKKDFTSVTESLQASR